MSRALAIVSELQSTLDMEAGGEIAASLDTLYGFVRDRLLDASIQPGRQALDEAVRVLTHAARRLGRHQRATAAPPRVAHMDKGQLTTLIDQYRAGLEAEIMILLRLEPIAARAARASAAHDLDALNRAADERDRLMAGARHHRRANCATSGRRCRQREEDAQGLPGYDEAVELHAQAIALVVGHSEDG